MSTSQDQIDGNPHSLKTQPPPTENFPDPSGAFDLYHNFRSFFEEANRIVTTESLDGLLGQVLDLMIRISGGTNGTFYLYDPEANELVFSIVQGNAGDQSLTGVRIRSNLGIVGSVFETCQPSIIADLKNDPQWYREIHPELTASLHSAITLPLVVESRAIGAVQIFNYQRVEIEFLQLLANRMASEVEKALLLEKSRTENIRLHILIESLTELSTTLDRNDILNTLTNNASKLTNAQSSSVFLVDSNYEQGAQWLSHSSHSDYGASLLGNRGDIPNHSRFQAGTTISVPLRARSILISKDHRGSDSRILGNLISMNKIKGIFDPEDSRFLEILAGHAGTSLQVAALFNQSHEIFNELCLAIALAVDSKEPFTRGHSLRVSEYALEIGRELEMNEEALQDLCVGSLLHDIGKMHVPDHILTKPGTLSDSEFEEIKKHPGKGYKILESVRLLRNILPAVIEHHERLDGSGYPHGLYGDQISLMGRIVAIADVFDALTTDRPYRKAMQLIDVLDFFEQNKNYRFDGVCVNALVRCVTRRNNQLYPAE